MVFVEIVVILGAGYENYGGCNNVVDVIVVVGGFGLVVVKDTRSTAECRKQDPQTVAGGTGGAGGDGGRGRGFNFQSGSLAGATGSGGSAFVVVVVDLLVQ